MTNHRSSWLGRFFSARMCFSQPARFYTLSLDNFEVLTSQFLCGNPAVRTTESRHDVRPARCRGHRQLPRVMFFRPAVTKNTYFYTVCFARRSGSPIALEFGLLLNRFWFLRSAQFMFLFVFWRFISTDFRLPLWAIPHNDPVHAVCWGFRLLSYCVNWLFTSSELLRELTVHIAQFRPRVIAVFPCVLPNIYGSFRRSLGRLLDVDNPSTFSTTTRLAAIADIVANRRRKFMV